MWQRGVSHIDQLVSVDKAQHVSGSEERRGLAPHRVIESHREAISASSSNELHDKDLAHLLLTQFPMDGLEIRLDNILLLIEDLQLDSATHEGRQDFVVLRISNSDDILRILAGLRVAPPEEFAIIAESEIACLAFDVLVVEELHELIHILITIRIQIAPLETSWQIYRLRPLILSRVNLLNNSLSFNLFERVLNKLGFPPLVIREDLDQVIIFINLKRRNPLRFDLLLELFDGLFF